MTYARVLMDIGMFEEAEAVLEHIMKSGGEDVGTLIMMGQLYTQRNDLAGIHSIAQKLHNQHADDIKARKFLKFLASRKLLPPTIAIADEPSATKIFAPPEKPAQPSPLAAAPAEEPQIISPELMDTVEAKVAAPVIAEPVAALRKEPAAPQIAPRPAKKPVEKEPPIPLPMEDLLRIISTLKGISGVQHAILASPGDKTMASSGCPTAIARAIGGLLRSMKRAMSVAFDALEFGKWTKGVIELDLSTIHLINVEGYWIALLCDPSVSLGALRIAVNSIISRHLKPSAMR